MKMNKILLIFFVIFFFFDFRVFFFSNEKFVTIEKKRSEYKKIIASISVRMINLKCRLCNFVFKKR